VHDGLDHLQSVVQSELLVCLYFCHSQGFGFLG
jgi:hypothetical protein